MCQLTHFSKLTFLCPQHTKGFIKQQNQHLNTLNALQKHSIEQLVKNPQNRCIVITNNNAFVYLGRELDIESSTLAYFLYSDVVSEVDISASTYLNMMRYNIASISLYSMQLKIIYLTTRYITT